MPTNKKIFAAVAVFIMTFSSQVASAATLIPGKIYLQVESHGEAWYISPTTLRRYFLGKPEDAFQVMRDLGLGISNKNLAQIPIGLLPNPTIDSDADGLPDNLEIAVGLDPLNPDSNNDDFADISQIENWNGTLDGQTLSINKTLINRLKGRILIQTEKHGQAWYVNPDNGKRYFLGRAADAFEVMRGLGVGITNANLNRTPEIFTGARYKVDGYYSFNYPSNWTISEDTADTDKLSFSNSAFKIAHKTVFTGKDATLTVYALDATSDAGLTNLNIASILNTTKDKNKDLIIGVKPGREQIFRYTKKVTINDLTFNKGAEFYVNIMINSRKFVRLQMIVPEYVNVATYEKTLSEMIKAIRIID